MPVPGIPTRRTETIGSSIFVKIYRGFFQYDVAQDQWIRLQPPLLPAKDGAMVQKQGLLFLLGGINEPNLDPKRRFVPRWLHKKHASIPLATDHIQTYNPIENKWKVEKATMPLPLSCHWAALVPLQEE